MEFLTGNPFSTPVGQRIEHATSPTLQSEDWGLNMEICDIINETEDGYVLFILPHKCSFIFGLGRCIP
uniref:Target of myb1 membrane trafficking protein n=1 Tax=Electrophorus electricus TaxID=8005 RepID=A0A4W4ECK3_ELEEL